jgi:hypothetical protein
MILPCQHHEPSRGRCPHLPGGAQLRCFPGGKNPVELRSTGQMRTSVPTWFVADTSIFDLAGGGMFCGFDWGFAEGFFQVGVQFVEFRHGQLGGPIFKLFEVQRGVEAHA